jgi:hypothetical protein
MDVNNKGSREDSNASSLPTIFRPAQKVPPSAPHALPKHHLPRSKLIIMHLHTSNPSRPDQTNDPG